MLGGETALPGWWRQHGKAFGHTEPEETSEVTRANREPW